MRKKLLLTTLVFLIVIAVAAEIVVKQDKNGKIIVSNIYSSYNVVAKSKGVSFAKSAGTDTIPRHFKIKIKNLSKKYGLKESLIVAVARAESSFNPFAVSSKGAIGIMQLMPETARQYGVFNRYNVDQNLEAGVKHLKYLYKKYNGIPPYKETRNYIKRVMKYMGLGYTSFFRPNVRQKIYKIVTGDGRIIITDQLHSNVKGEVTLIE